MVASNLEVEAIINKIERWSTESRILLARRVLETLHSEPSVANSSTEFKGRSGAEVLGIWSRSDTAPNDAECDAILVEELSMKHLK